MSQGVIELSEGHLYALVNPYPVDGPVSTHPSNADGFSSMNVYVLLDDEGAAIIDTGWSIHEEALLEQLHEVIPADVPVSIVLTRAGEFNSICNVRSIAEHFHVHSLHGLFPSITEWVDFRPKLAPFGTQLRAGGLHDIQDVQVRIGDSMLVGAGRRLDVVRPPLRLLPTCWLYDERTRTLFTSDAFTHVWATTPAGPWVVTDPDAAVDSESITSYLLGSRFWWLALADAAPIAAELDAVFEAHDVETVAPGFGAIFVGAEVVRAQHAVLDEVLGAMPTVSA